MPEIGTTIFVITHLIRELMWPGDFTVHNASIAATANSCWAAEESLIVNVPETIDFCHWFDTRPVD